MEEIKEREIIGRDNLLSRQIYPRLKKDQAFIIVGQRGIGKTEVLQWAYKNYEKEIKMIVSCNESYGNIIKGIAKKQGITVHKKTIGVLEKEIMKGEKVTLFLDDIERIKPKQITFLNAWNNWNKIFFSGVEPFREEAKKILWGKQKIRIHKLNTEDREVLAKHIIKKIGCVIEIETIAQSSKGVPGRAWAVAKGEVVREDEERVKGEEINIAPVMLVAVVAIMVTRYISLGLGERDLYILAGIGMAFAYILKQFIRVLR